MILANEINVRFTTSLVLRAGSPEKGTKAIMLEYEVFHTDWADTVLDSGSFVMHVNQIGVEMVAIDQSLRNKATTRLSEIITHHEGISTIGGYSLFDANLILDGWKFYEGAGIWHGEHPVSGEFSGSLNPTLDNRINALLSLVLPPSTWAWASSPSAGDLEVRCIAVPGADHYAVYNGIEHLGDIPDHNSHTLSVLAGNYSVRVAAVSDRVGVMSVITQVLVG